MLSSGSSKLYRSTLSSVGSLCASSAKRISISYSNSSSSRNFIINNKRSIINNINANSNSSIFNIQFIASRSMSSASAAPDEAKIAANAQQLEEEYKKEIGEIHEEYKDRERRRNSIMGVVVSTMCQKSVSVQYYHNRFYPKYHCILPVRRKVMAHDEEEKCHVGDLVRVVPCRPMSKMKRHNLLEIVKKAKSMGDSKTGRREKIQRIFPKK